MRHSYLEGDEGAKAAEMENIQTAMDTYMADNGVATVASNLVTATATMSGSPDLSTYLRNATTTYFYCWDTAGLVNSQKESAVAC